MTDRDARYREAHRAERAAYMREYRKRGPRSKRAVKMQVKFKIGRLFVGWRQG
jgi:hypothetical protein